MDVDAAASHLDFDVGNLSVFDLNPVRAWKSYEECEEVLHALAAKNAQMIFNEIFSLPTTSSEDGVMAMLPPPKALLPRSKPVPSAKPKTRWEQFAQAKGIQKKKRSRMVLDESSGEYRPRYGYQSTGNMDDWIVEVPQNADQTEDQYEKKAKAKSERISKNKMQNRRNTEEAAALRTGSSALGVKKQKLKSTIVQANVSTASIGKFNKSVEGEEKIKFKREKRKFDPLIMDGGEEKNKTLKVVESISKKIGADDVLNVRKTKKCGPPKADHFESEGSVHT
ncbi:Rhodanese- sulfurtransferase [Dinochytrium kinnereticum]|nr:Rhodanese- sulfurtransferase [Dinochytrium kinnereticum]